MSDYLFDAKSHLGIAIDIPEGDNPERFDERLRLAQTCALVSIAEEMKQLNQLMKAVTFHMGER